MALIDSIRTFARSIRQDRDPNVLGIDIGTSFIKVVQLKRTEKALTLETYGELALGPYAGKNIGEAVSLSTPQLKVALGDILREAKTSTNNCGVAIPLSASLITLIEVPTDDPQKLAELMPIEARKYIPVPIDEVFLDWQVISGVDEPSALATKKEGSSKEDGLPKPVMPSHAEVLLFAIHKEVMEDYQNLIKQSGLTATFYEIEIFSTIRSVLEEGAPTTLIVDMGVRYTKIYIVTNGIVRNSHKVNKGAQDITMALSSSLNIDITQAEEIKRTINLSTLSDGAVRTTVNNALDYLISEIRAFLRSFEETHKTNVKQIILTGGGALLGGVDVHLSNAFEIPAVLANPFRTVQAPEFMEPLLRQIGPEFAVAIGVALRKVGG